jgi:hypothetical protein
MRADGSKTLSLNLHNHPGGLPRSQKDKPASRFRKLTWSRHFEVYLKNIFVPELWKRERHVKEKSGMKSYGEKFKPAVEKPVLLFMAGALWIAVGAMLLSFAYHWTHFSWEDSSFLRVCAGVVLALVIHHFGFLRIVDKNLDRILPMKGKRCLFSFMTWKSYATVAVMAGTGIFLRHSSIPKSYLAILYTGIGLALILSSVRYLRILFRPPAGNDISAD